MLLALVMKLEVRIYLSIYLSRYLSTYLGRYLGKTSQNKCPSLTPRGGLTLRERKLHLLESATRQTLKTSHQQQQRRF